MPGLLGGKPVINCKGTGSLPGYPTTPLHSGSRYVGHQQSKGNKYQVEVLFKVKYGYSKYSDLIGHGVFVMCRSTPERFVTTLIKAHLPYR